MVQSTEEKLGMWIEAATNIAQDHEVRLDKLEKLVEGLFTFHKERLKLMKAELAELEGK